MRRWQAKRTARSPLVSLSNDDRRRRCVISEPTAAILFRTAFAMSAGPWSERISPGKPRRYEPSWSQSRKPFRLTSGNLVPIMVTDPFDLLPLPDPTVTTEQGRDPTVAIPPVLDRSCDDRGRRNSLVLDRHGGLASGRTTLAPDTTGEAFRYAMLGSTVVDMCPAARRTQKFCWRCPSGTEAASFRIAFSRAKSEIARRNRGARSQETSTA
jgi:hypothetical protein